MRHWWELLLVPTLVGFVVLAVYAGFYLHGDEPWGAMLFWITGWIAGVAVLTGWLILGFSWRKPGRWVLLDATIAALVGVLAGLVFCPVLGLFMSLLAEAGLYR